MQRILLSLAFLGAACVIAASSPTTGHPADPARTAAGPAAPARHCQVPCGIYGDKMRIDMLMEDAATIEKGMQVLGELKDAERNQIVRWVMTKDEHAQSIQDTIAAYWMAQRIKLPAADADAAALAKYHRQLGLLHGITVAAMKCKQTTDKAHVATVRELALAFSETYFTKEDLEHIKSHHDGEHR
jgi:hypothetical protein